METNGKIDVEANTPLGKLAAKGIRTSDLISFVGIGAMCVMVWQIFEHKADAAEGDKAVVQAIKENSRETANAIREQAKATQKIAENVCIQTCVMIAPQDNRERVYASCKLQCGAQ